MLSKLPLRITDGTGNISAQFWNVGNGKVIAMDQMKRLSELAAKMAETTNVENTTNSWSPDDEPLNVTCFDPEAPDKPCPICRGMGVIKYAVTPDDPRFGKLFR